MNLIFHDLLGIVMEVYIEDVVVKLADFAGHLADLRLAFERTRRYGLKMNPNKCAFGVSAGRFLGFVVHENGIEIDPKKVEAIKRIPETTCKREVQSLLGKLNYLQRFISNLAGRVKSLLPLVRMKHEREFTSGVEQQRAFNWIKEYLMSPPMLRAHENGKKFRLYISAHERVIGVVLTQESAGKEFAIAYLSRRMLDVETRYVHIKKLCLALYYAYSKFRHYILSSSCTVIGQHDVVRHMMQKPILSGRVGEWTYSLVEFDLAYELLRAVKGQVVSDFIVDHDVRIGDTTLVAVCPWKVFFDGFVCAKGRRVGCVVQSPNGTIHEVSSHLEFECTNNQIEYEALTISLEFLIGMEVRDVEAFGDSKLVVGQVRGNSQCLDGTLNCYLDKCMQLIGRLDSFQIEHTAREHNKAANSLAQQALGYEVKRRRRR
jgi:ribonuclease HI